MKLLTFMMTHFGARGMDLDDAENLARAICERTGEDPEQKIGVANESTKIQIDALDKEMGTRLSERLESAGVLAAVAKGRTT